MYWLVGLLSLSLIGIMAMGVYYEFNPLQREQGAPRWVKATLGGNLMSFVIGLAGMLLLGVNEVMAAEAAGGAAEISIGMGLAIIGIGIPTAFATIGAGIAVGPVGAASLAIISEKPEMFGRTLIYLGLAEGIAIYGLVVTILLLGKI